jgi:hypothetical protein
MIMRFLLYPFMLLIAAVQVPAWLWAKARGKNYQWWGGAQ